MCQGLVTFLPTDSCFNEPALYVGLVQDLLAMNQDNVSEFSDISTRGRCFSELALYVGLVQRLIGYESG